jgi:4-amino-4-deoxy-L-arabinose transferase-like glycosyltransferase
MAASALATSETAAGRSARLALRVFPFLLFFLALAPRLAAINRYITPDELIWVYRSIVFREAVLDGRWADTIVAGHPGVTTTWLGTLATSARLTFSPAARASYDWLTRMAFLMPDNTEAFVRLAQFLEADRTAVAVVNAAGVVFVYLLARKLWGIPTAVFGALLLALDPFTAGLAGLFHVDGLSATFGTLSLLALAIGLRPVNGPRARPGWLALAGGLAALAGLSKSPLLLLGPVTAAALVTEALVGTGPFAERLKRMVLAGLVWGGAFAATLLVYPAIWADPLDVARSLTSNAGRHIEEALRPTFFLGRVAFDHGPLFYPVALLWRSSPVVAAALIPALRGLLAAVRRRSLSGLNPPSNRHATWLLAAWVVLFLIAITPAAKKFDRYMLPVIPSLLLLAAVALVPWLVATRRRWALPALVGVQALFLLFHAAYPLSAYNPLVGGPYTAARVMPVGWGEGISAGGRWLAETQPDASQARAIAGVAPSLAPFFPGQTLVEGVDSQSAADYVIQTITGRQTQGVQGDRPPTDMALLKTIRFGGLDQAWVYRQVPAPSEGTAPPALDPPVLFGDQLALEAAGVSYAQETVRAIVEWRRLRALAADEHFLLRLVLRDRAGNAWTGIETELLDAVYFHPPDWIDDASGPVRYALETPPGIPPGEYELVASVVDERTAGRLPVRTGDKFQGVDVSLGTVVVLPPETPDAVTRLQIPVIDDRPWLAGALRLLGHSALPPEALAGSDLPVDFFWHSPAHLPAGLQVSWMLRAADGETTDLGTVPLSRYDTGQWRAGETIQEKYRLALPPALAPGDYVLSAMPLAADGMPLGERAPVGGLRINNIDRLYELPAEPAAGLDVAFGPDIRLRAAGLQPSQTQPVGTSELTLVWQADGEPDRVYTAFVHLLNETGDIVAQFDHWPGGLPSDIWAEGQVIIDRVPMSLPVDLAPGTYRIALGLYDTEEGVRLPVSGAPAEGLVIEADRIILPETLVVTVP